MIMINVLYYIFKIFLWYWVQLFTALRLPLSLGCRACIEWLQMIWNTALDSILSSFQQQWLQTNFQLLCPPVWISKLNLLFFSKYLLVWFPLIVFQRQSVIFFRGSSFDQCHLLAQIAPNLFNRFSKPYVTFTLIILFSSFSSAHDSVIRSSIFTKLHQISHER